MIADVVIIGQGLAGSVLGWACERAGIAFQVIDRGHAQAASAVAAGIINPITGRRLVKSWHVDTLLPEAREMYQEIGDALGVKIWHPARVRRLFADNREGAVYVAKCRSGELAPFAGAGDDEGFWIEPAARVDVGALLTGMRQRWQSQGRLREAVGDCGAELKRGVVVIDCTGMPGSRSEPFAFVPWEHAKGETLRIRSTGCDPTVILNRRHWVAPVSRELAWVGATHEPGVIDPTLTASGRQMLEESARALLGRDVHVVEHLAGVRVHLPDKLPAVGWHPHVPRLGAMNGLGAKGALYAPALARAWVGHLVREEPFDHSLDVQRFTPKDANRTPSPSP